jgi:hypothetical protein
MANHSWIAFVLRRSGRRLGPGARVIFHREFIGRREAHGMSAKTAYWGRLEGRPEQVRAFEMRPDILPMPKGEMYLAALGNLLRNEYGFIAATEVGLPCDASGNPMPLFTYPCIEYLAQFDLREKSVFEWGSGASTLYWMTRAASIVSIENNPAWFERLRPQVSANVRLVLDSTAGFASQIDAHEGPFDIIVIDSYGYRFDCAAKAVDKLAPGGIVILDNAEWHPNSAAEIRRRGLIQVDFSGFKAGEFHASTTSLFLSRDFDFKTLQPNQPAFCMGAKRVLSAWDEPGAPP